MNIALKVLVLVYLLAMGVTQASLLTPMALAALLLMLGLHTCRQRLYDHTYLLAVEFVVITVAIAYGAPLSLWYAVLAFDLAFKKLFVGLIPILGAIYVYSLYPKNPLLLLLTALAVLLALALNEIETQNLKHQHTLDKERRLRYSLEETKQKLLKSQEEVEHITEVQERNRIAHEIHDSVGHNIAGILMQMQVAHKCLDQDKDKTRVALTKSISKLTETLEILRDTVHNLRPIEKAGIDYIRAIIDDYEYCPVEFLPSGDLSNIPPRLLQAVASIVKEALTNTSRYSKATNVRIELDVNDKFLRLYILDNGVGCSHVRAGLGLSGMRERVTNLGGTITVSGDEGFLIVCVLYR
ncbi:MAG: Integral membrane sensor signal transduction histidine kinase [Bacillota bacterium]|nr:MAG: Integral membrane sensor signal transduction histidine kinase [Bacillota bacterium]MBS3949262.1 sensor histidine kinase [Peptococcaceae bacterium]